MIRLINDIRKKLNELEERLMEIENNKIFPPCFAPMSISYVDLSNCTNETKMQRIVEQIEEYNINMLPTPQDSNIVRSALVAELGEKGLGYWLSIRKFREDYDENQQIKRYNNMLKYREYNTMTFGAVINRYRQAIDIFNENNQKQIINN